MITFAAFALFALAVMMTRPAYWTFVADLAEGFYPAPQLLPGQSGNPYRFKRGNGCRLRTEARSIGGVGYTRQVNGKSGRTMRYLKATTKGNSR